MKRSPLIRALINIKSIQNYHSNTYIPCVQACMQYENIIKTIFEVWMSWLDKLTFFVLKCLTWSIVMCGIWKRQLLPRLHIPCTTIWLTFITFSNVSNDGTIPGRGEKIDGSTHSLSLSLSLSLPPSTLSPPLSPPSLSLILTSFILPKVPGLSKQIQNLLYQLWTASQ